MTAPADLANLAVPTLGPDDPGYDAARAVFNAMIDRRPLAIVRCRDAADVAEGIRWARAHDLALSVRSGGHGVSGNAVCDGGIVLDLSGMRAVSVDPGERRADAGPGLLLGDLDAATARHGLATPLGVMSGTGIAGLTLGGGLGWLAGKHGLACDNLVGAEVVTADGEVLQVGPESHADLYWGLRGGGGNLGVVTSFRYRLHPVTRVLAGALTYPWSEARSALLERQQFLATAPDELSSVASLGLGDDGRPALTVLACWSGDLDEGERILQPLRGSAAVVDDTIGPVDFVDWQRAPDAGYPRGRRHYWKSGYLRHLTEAAVDDLLAVAGTIPNPETGIGMQGLRGAASRVAVDATAFPHRAPQDDLLILAQWSDPARSDEIIAWARGAHDRLRPHLEDAVYVNNLGNEGGDRVRAAYGPNHVRLAELKRRYDPENVFRLNQNIPPS